MNDERPEPASSPPLPQPPSAAVSPIVGIDLGTTNSLVAIAAWPRATDLPRVIPDEQGRNLCPSAVRFEAGHEPVVGYDAKDRAVEFPLTTVVSAKRLMGRSLADAAADLRYLSYRVVEGPNNTARIALPGVKGNDASDGTVADAAEQTSEQTVSPQEVSALILRRLKDQASRALGVPVTRAVVTVPAYFDDAQRQATRDAARLAGLDAVRIVAEPTAAALAYGLGLRADASRVARTVVVYDLGGGTFDVSVLRITPPDPAADAATAADAFEVIATAGDTHLGGDDFDYTLVSLFTREIGEQFFQGVDIGASLSPEVKRALHDFAERTKIRLSEHDRAEVLIDLGPVPKGGDGAGNAGHERRYRRTVTRAEFEGLIMLLIDRTITACKRALRDAKRGMAGESLAAVVMVGGSTRVPLVRRRVQEVFGLQPYTALDPDLVVALGAAVQASILSGATRNALLLDVIPLSLGIETAGGAFAKIIMRNASIPAVAHEMFSTQVDGQTSIKLNVLQGEREMAADCRSLGTFHLRGIPPMPAGIPQLRVEFRIDANGVLGVNALERRSGKRLDVQIVPNSGLTRDEVDRIERESHVHAREDMVRHRLADLVANSKLDLHWITQQLARHGDRLAPTDRVRIEEAVSALRAFVNATAADVGDSSIDADAFHRAKESLDRASMPLHEVSIAESLKQE